MQPLAPAVFWSIAAAIIIVMGVLGWLLNRFVLTPFDPTRTILFVGLGLLMGAIVVGALWWFIQRDPKKMVYGAKNVLSSVVPAASSAIGNVASNMAANVLMSPQDYYAKLNGMNQVMGTY